MKRKTKHRIAQSAVLTLVIVAWILLGFAFLHDAFAEERPIATATVVVRKGSLNGRNKPDICSQQMAYYPNGTAIDIYELDGEWGRTVGGEAYYCWVNLRYLTNDAAGMYTVSDKGGVRVRQKPDTTSERLATLRYGATIEVTGIFGDWAFSKKGWIMKEFLQRNED